MRTVALVVLEGTKVKVWLEMEGEEKARGRRRSPSEDARDVEICNHRAYQHVSKDIKGRERDGRKARTSGSTASLAALRSAGLSSFRSFAVCTPYQIIEATRATRASRITVRMSFDCLENLQNCHQRAGLTGEASTRGRSEG